jgi:hypothetical protein
MSTFNYTFAELYGNQGEGTSSIDLTAGTPYTFTITNNSGSSYFTLETVRNYDGVTPQNTSGSYTSLTNIATSVISDYIAGFSLPQGINEFIFTPSNNVSGSTLRFRGTGGIILGVTSERARQVTNRAVRKLVHPARMSVIRKQYPKITSDDVWGILKLRGKNK